MNTWTLTPNRFLSKAELGELLRKAEDLRALGLARNQKQLVRDWAIIRFSLLSGLRANELAQLKVTDCFVGYARSEVGVRCGKGGKSRVVHIGEDLKRDLRWYLGWKRENSECGDDEFLIRSQRAPKMTSNALWRRWKKYCPEHRLHDARHTNAVLLYEASKDIRLVQKQLGHSRISTTAIYADVCDERMKAGLTSMEGIARLAMKGPKDCELPRNLPRKPSRIAGTVAS